ncbi:Type II secretory pathway, component PulK [Pseudidiomarina woesei]|uniref:Type II secretory pathway, component PulK n=2 Tax=Pseudidiomarina woesei TaxID=1381080 RepID=A0A0K6H6G6_9GAMM|nr:type II secretion system minor pseudopilin GspK [Pseudidiomarina woesei]CUA86498.1 Type II secretory pathway, component PulK [Pseudidiomarina woesei]
MDSRNRCHNASRSLNVSIRKQRGVALLMVLLVVALVSVMAVTLSGRLQTTVLRTANFQQAEQAYWYWLSAEEIVRELLQTELSESDGVAHQQQMWYQQSESGNIYPVDGGAIQGGIQDLHSCFNLNSLREGGGPGSGPGSAPPSSLRERRKAQLRMLLLSVGDDDIEPYTADVIVDSLADWLDQDDNIDGNYGAESVDYQSLLFPHGAANTWLTHVSELRLIRGVTAKIFNDVKDYVCVIPRDNSLKINVNTVAKEQPELLYAVTLGALAEDEAQQFLNTRRGEGYESLDDARNNGELSSAAAQGPVPNFGGGIIPEGVTAETIGGALDDLDVKSKYFQLNAKIGYGDLVIAAQSQFLITKEEAKVLFRANAAP